MNILNGRTIACYRTENICFAVDLIAKENAIRSEKWSEILIADKCLEGECDIDLH